MTRARALPVDAVNVANLVALFVPPALFALGLYALRDDARFGWVRALRPPIELWVIFVSGTVATLGGIADWRFHRAGHRVVGRAESRAELIALAGGGVPLFALMALATARARPGPLLVPVLVVALFTAGAITYDEVRFHRRNCSLRERVMHATLVLGNGVAWLAWMHYVFARPL